MTISAGVFILLFYPVYYTPCRFFCSCRSKSLEGFNPPRFGRVLFSCRNLTSDNLAMNFHSSDTETKIFRLFIAISVVVVVVFGYLFFEHQHQARINHELVVKISSDNRDRFYKCVNSPPPCDGSPYFEGVADQAAQRSGVEADKAKFFLSICVGVPSCLFLLFFGGRWVLTGQFKKSA